jgi:RimJ/RimL family protein N-acetyltransferase
MVIEGERVRLRPATAADMPHYTRWWTDPEFRRYMGPGDDTLDALTRQQPDQVNFSVELLDGRLIGAIFVTRIRTVNRNCELGIVAIGEPDCRERGLGPEAVRLALEFCFGQLGMHQVHIVTAEFNERARRCYGRIFPNQQRHRQWVWQDGRFWDEVYFDITEEEFRALELT